MTFLTQTMAAPFRRRWRTPWDILRSAGVRAVTAVRRRRVEPDAAIHMTKFERERDSTYRLTGIDRGPNANADQVLYDLMRATSITGLR